jgi:5-formaminoimidazole-4-carboxamide-1-beta-D-ribofuranosyl 5'-monophosphate synthetase
MNLYLIRFVKVFYTEVEARSFQEAKEEWEDMHLDDMQEEDLILTEIEEYVQGRKVDVLHY